MDWWPFVVSAACAGMLMPLAIHVRSIGHGEFHGVQSLHDVPTSRLGGIVVVVACAITMALVLSYGQDKGFVGLPLVLAVVPVVLFGLAEDVTREVRPRYRMAAAVVSAMLASVYSGGIVPRLDLPFVDDLLQHMWFVLPVTWFMVAGACNAMNLIDGAHGLAGGTALIMLGGIALAAGLSADPVTLTKTLVVMGALVGFLCWNYPRGHVFLGPRRRVLHRLHVRGAVDPARRAQQRHLGVVRHHAGRLPDRRHAVRRCTGAEWCAACG